MDKTKRQELLKKVYDEQAEILVRHEIDLKLVDTMIIERPNDTKLVEKKTKLEDTLKSKQTILGIIDDLLKE